MGPLTVSVTTTTLPNTGAVLRRGLWLGATDLLSSMATEWPLWAAIGLVFLASLVVRLHAAKRLARSGIADIDRMDGRTFEEYLGTLFRGLGYRAQVTPYSGDYGGDLVVRRDGRSQVIQAKRSNRPVGPRAVQEVIAARPHYHCQGAVVVTNRTFTAAARRLAASNGVTLWDRRDLVDKVVALHRQQARRARPPGPPASLADVAVGSAPLSQLAPLLPGRRGASPRVAPSHCSTCGAPVTDRVRDYCLARPGRFAGRIYCFRHQRSGSR